MEKLRSRIFEYLCTDWSASTKWRRRSDARREAIISLERAMAIGEGA